MKTRFLTLALIASSSMTAVALAAAPASPSQSPAPSRGQSTPPRQSYSERYGMLSERNIFLRERPRPSTERRQTSSNDRPRRSPEETYVVRGIVIEEDGLIRAYVEDLGSGRLIQLAPGDTVARGRVRSIQIDAVQYESSSGQSEWVEVGSDFTGRSPRAETAVSSAESPSTAPSGPPIDPNDPNLTAEQKMRLRRQQELQR